MLLATNNGVLELAAVRSATAAILLKHFTYLLVHLAETDGAGETFDNDSCSY
jgi:hypothetical protein